MLTSRQNQPPERAAIIEWTARMGAITAGALAHRHSISPASARARLSGAERAELLSRQRPLSGEPALYTITRRGMRACGLRGLDPCRVSASNALHSIVCAEAAAALERCYPDHRVLGERECGRPLASAQLGLAAADGLLLHRPDLVLRPTGSAGGLAVAVEVELTVKAPRRLVGICTAWARCRCVAGVLYLVAPEVEQALGRAVESAQAGERIAVVPLSALPSVRASDREQRP
jgi:hypothetical protein